MQKVRKEAKNRDHSFGCSIKLQYSMVSMKGEERMILGYIDESGINYSQDSKGYFYVDGPYAIWSCVLISEKRYFDLERAFQDLAKKYLGNNIKKRELHATEIWKSRKDNNAQNKK